MSKDQNVAKRYARALFELAKDRQETDRIGEELAAVAEVLGEPGVEAFFSHPSIEADAKLDVLDKALAGRVSESVLHTLHLMIRRGRANVLQALVEQYSLMADEHAGRATAIVTTPMPLTEGQAEEIAAHYSRLTGKQIGVKNVVNKELLGGMQVRIGDRLYDASLSAKLERLKKQFA